MLPLRRRLPASLPRCLRRLARSPRTYDRRARAGDGADSFNVVDPEDGNINLYCDDGTDISCITNGVDYFEDRRTRRLDETCDTLEAYAAECGKAVIIAPSAAPTPIPPPAEYCEQSLEALAEECGKIIVSAPTDAPSLTPTSSRAPIAGVSSACFLDGGDCASCCAMCTEVDADSTDNRDASGCVCLAALGTDLPALDYGDSVLEIHGSDYDVPPPASVGSFFQRPVRP